MAEINRLPPVRVAEVAEVAAAEFGVTVEDLRGPRRHADLVRARHVAFLVAQGYGLSLSEIARYFGRDHTTVMSGVRRARELHARAEPDRVERIQMAVRPVFRHRPVGATAVFRSSRRAEVSR